MWQGNAKPWQAFNYLEEAYNLGYSIEDLKDIAKSVRNWTQFEDEMERIITG